MKISQIRIENFRAFEDETINLDDYNCFVGANGSGKSTILMALNILFRNTQAPSDVVALKEEDFRLRNTSVPVRITVWFSDLSEEAKSELKEYVRQDQLVITAKAKWDAEAERAEVKQVGIRSVMQEFKRYFEAEKQGRPVYELKSIFAGLRNEREDIAQATTKADMKQALRDYEESHPELCENVESDDQFYGWSRGENRLRKHCQWIYIPAVKDATQEQDENKTSALGKLLQRSIRSKVDFSDDLEDIKRDLGHRYKEVLEQEQNILDSTAAAIQNRLQEWAHPGARVELHWHYDEQKSVRVEEPYARAEIGEGNFLGELVRSGHGIQRSFLVALLQELASVDEDVQPTLLLGFEEPELYQHPPQARHLSSVLESLSTQEAQVLVTTHSPYFVSGKGFESIRITRNIGEDAKANVKQMTAEQLSEKLAEALGEDPRPRSSVMAAVEQILQPSQNEMFFSQVPILVEGLEDVAFISSHLHLTDKWRDFRRLGCHFVVCEGKGPLSRPLAIAEGLGIPAFVIFDGDCDQAQKDGGNKQVHIRDNSCIQNLCGLQPNPLADTTLWNDRLVMWPNNIMAEVKSNVGEEEWNQAETEARNSQHLTDGVRQKNSLLIAATLEELDSKGIRSQSLDKLCDHILSWAESSAKSTIA